MATYGGGGQVSGSETLVNITLWMNYKPGPFWHCPDKELKFFRQQSSACEPNKAPLRAVSKWYFHGNVMR